MRQYSIMFSIVVLCFSSYAQTDSKTKLTKPTDEFLRTINPINDTLDELTFLYLKTYYRTKGKVHYTFNGSNKPKVHCQWYQKFTNGFVYEYEGCVTRGFVATITFPDGTTKEDIVLLVETLYKTPQNEWWDAEKTIYASKSKEIGCVHEIEFKEGRFILRNCCYC